MGYCNSVAAAILKTENENFSHGTNKRHYLDKDHLITNFYPSLAGGQTVIFNASSSVFGEIDTNTTMQRKYQSNRWIASVEFIKAYVQFQHR